MQAPQPAPANQPQPGQSQGPQGQAPEGQEDESQEAGPQKAAEGMVAIQSGMVQLLQMMAQMNNVPANVLNSLKGAIDNYKNFLAGAMKAMGIDAGVAADDDSGPGSQDEMSGGAKGAMPADQMMGGKTGKPVY